MTTSKIKVYELAKELGQESQNLVDVIQRLGIDVKNSMSVLGSEEVRTVREYYRKNRSFVRAGAAPVATTKPGVTEKRVGSNVIRRRAAKPVVEAPVNATSSESFEEPTETSEVEVFATEENPVESSAAEFFEDQTNETIEVVAEELAIEETSEPEAEMEAPPVATAPPTPPTPSTPPRVKVVEPPPPTPKRAEEKKARRIFPSIIKKTTVEQHLGETVGPKVEKRERPRTVVVPGSAAARARPGTTPTGTPRPGTTTTTVGVGLKRVKEVEAPLTEAAKEANRRRMAQRQDSVFRSTDYLKRELIHATKKKKNAINRPAMKTQVTQRADHKRVVEMGESITVAELSKAMGVKGTAVVQKLFAMGVTATLNQAVDFDTATLVSQEFSYEIKQQVFREEDFVPSVEMDSGKLEGRPPVVTIMGHVDHGKTTLLDTIRKAKVAAGEAGGITQHIGAYTVEIPKGKITFVDTPGHEAFTGMRARGAKVTDIVIIVVSAIDGVMPQTLESIAHAKAAGVPIIVAVNKMDLPDANPDRIKQTLAGHELTPEEWGGETIYAGVSAKTGLGVDALLESILLQAEMLELKANYDSAARGAVIESRLDKMRGPVATVLVQHGKLAPGQMVVSGTTFGRIRAMSDSSGRKVEEALPSYAVELLGISEVPVVGDEFVVVDDERSARELVEARTDKSKAAVNVGRAKVSLEEMITGPGPEKELRVILKSDVQGSGEALREAMSKFPTDKVKMKILHVGTGGITESDVMLASASGAIILGFNVRPDIKALKRAEADGIQVRTYSIIYDLLADVKDFLEGLLDKEVREKVIGRAEVREIFSVPKIGTVAGSAVIDGKVIRGCFLRLLRDSRVIYEGKISSLRRFKEDVKEVTSGFECGIGLENFSDLKQGDQFEAFLKEESKGSL